MIGIGQKESYVGYEAQSKRDVLSISYPIQSGIITNWHDMERIWHYIIYKELRVSPEQQSILLTEALLNPAANREKMAEIMFESFGVPALCIGIQPVLSLYNYGRTTGITLESGENVTYAVPIYESFPLFHAVRQIPMGGRDITEYLSNILRECDHQLAYMPEKAVIQDIKEKLCYVSLDMDAEIQSGNEIGYRKKVYELPDGQCLTLGPERLRVPEALFRPSLAGLDVDGLHKLVYNSVLKCDSDLHRELCGNIVLSGGGMMFPGISDRLHSELIKFFPWVMGVRVSAYPDRIHGAWIGGSIVASLNMFDKLCVTKGEYADVGPAIVHRKRV
ncbi:actin [Serendipita sp. 411]|nr:actin [Serendipita sp. 400]KAG8828110.1 actin [Serendipita sp. 401]KAG8849031.1 actin [Serendipita sp. 411]KAG9058415.1 actin [Serendipita sp. 407]